jgi:hypothetical protein
VSKLLYFLPLALAACAYGQTVEGTVINSVTGAGIGGAKVVLQQGQTSAYSATADATGHFRIEGVKEGAYSARYTADRYFSNRRNAPIQFVAGTAPVRIEGWLVPLARISGRVVDPSGQVVPGAFVELTTLQNFWTARTDDQGRFNIDSVMPGMAQYTLQAVPPPGWKPPAPEQTGRLRSWATTFYPGVTRRELAGAIALAAGSDVQGLEIKLIAAPTHGVRGVLLKHGGAAAPNVSLLLRETGASQRALQHTQSNSNGAFEFPAVGDGEWRLHAEWKDQDATLIADEWIDVRGRDLESLKVRLVPPFTVSGQVIVEKGEGQAAPTAPAMRLFRVHGGQILFGDEAVFTAQPGADGRFRFEGMYPGAYVFQPGGSPPQGYYLDSIQQGAAPVWDGVEISADSPELTVVYKTHGGTVRGSVEKCGSGQVWLVRQDRPRSARVADCGGSGSFQISAVRPGEYLAVAVPDFGPRPVDQVLLQGASRATVRAGETTQLDLRLSGLR